MATISRIRFAWTGSAVAGGGVSTFYSSNSDPSVLATAIRTFYVSSAGQFPATLEIACPSGGETIDEVSGAVNGAWSMTPGANVIGAGGTNYAAGVGMRCVFNTGAVVRRRRIRGSTYLVPLVSGAYDTSGTITNATLSPIVTALATMVAADGGSLRVYTRPQTTTSNDGAAHAVTSAVAVDKVSWLRSRRV